MNKKLQLVATLLGILGISCAMAPAAAAVVAPPTVTVQQIAGSKGASAGVVMSDGSVYVWGDNEYGQLGNGSTTDRNIPIQLPNHSNVQSLSFGYSHMLALKADGTVWVSGDNYNHQLGITAGFSRVPVQVGIPSMDAVSAGDEHSLALNSVTGTVYRWGTYSDRGESLHTAPDPEVVNDIPSKVKQIAAGGHFDLALTVTGEVYAWGVNREGQLGNDSDIGDMSPQRVLFSAGTLIRQVAAGTSRAVAVTVEGAVYQWGYFAEEGEGSLTPIKVTGDGFTNIQSVSCGNEHCVALKSDHTVWGWGKNGSFQLAKPATLYSTVHPVDLASKDPATMIEAGENFNTVLTTEGKLISWGQNNNGQLGLGDFDNRYTPEEVQLSRGIPPKPAYAFTEVTPFGQIFVIGFDQRLKFDLSSLPAEDFTIKTEAGSASGVHPTAAHVISDGTYLALFYSFLEDDPVRRMPIDAKEISVGGSIVYGLQGTGNDPFTVSVKPRFDMEALVKMLALKPDLTDDNEFTGKDVKVLLSWLRAITFYDFSMDDGKYIPTPP